MSVDLRNKQLRLQRLTIDGVTKTLQEWLDTTVRDLYSAVSSLVPAARISVLNGSAEEAYHGDLAYKAATFQFKSWDDSDQFRIGNTVLAVNYLQARGGIASNGPILEAVGADQNIPIQFVAKGTGGFIIGNGSGPLFSVSDDGSGMTVVNYFDFKPAQSGQSPRMISQYGSKYEVALSREHQFIVNGQICLETKVVPSGVTSDRYPIISAGNDYVRYSVGGTATNINVLYGNKGTGSHAWFLSGGTIFTIDPGGISSGIVTGVVCRGGQAGVAPRLFGSGETNTPLRLSGSGTGSVQANKLERTDILLETGWTERTDGSAHTIGATISSVMYRLGGTLASASLTMPASPENGRVVDISTSHDITAFTLNANAGQSISGAPTTLLPTTPVKFRYVSATTRWVRVA